MACCWTVIVRDSAGHCKGLAAVFRAIFQFRWRQPARRSAGKRVQDERMGDWQVSPLFIPKRPPRPFILSRPYPFILNSVEG